MALNVQNPTGTIVNADGSAVLTDPATPPASLGGGLAPAAVGGTPGVFGRAVLAALLAALASEGVIANYSVAAGTPTAAAGANNGTSPPAPVVGAGSTDASGTVTFGSGSTPAAGAQVGVTYGVATYPSAPRVVLVANNSATQALGLYVSARTATGFTVSSANAPTASQANTTYSFDFIVCG